MPSFLGGNAELRKCVSENLRYPEIAKEQGVQGRVILRFEIDGSISDVDVVNSIDSAKHE